MTQRIILCSIDQPGTTSDFWNIGDGPKGKVLGKSGNENQLTEYVFGKGKVIVLGHHSPAYTDTKSENLKRLTTNIIEYLASVSMFGSPVKPLEKLTTTWAGIKVGVEK